MRKRSAGTPVNPIESIRVVLMKTIDEILLALGLWNSEIEIRAKSSVIDEKTDFLVDALIGMAEILKPYPTTNEVFEPKYNAGPESTTFMIFMTLMEKKLWIVRSKISLLRKYVQQAQTSKRLMSVACVIRVSGNVLRFEQGVHAPCRNGCRSPLSTALNGIQTQRTRTKCFHEVVPYGCCRSHHH
jgi:hypothetical protein